MKLSIGKSFLIGSAICLGIGGIFGWAVVTIPTKIATHQARLDYLYIGSGEMTANPSISIMDGNTNVYFSGDGVIVGDRDNKVINSPGASVLGGGEGIHINQIIGGANSVIAGGRGNEVTIPDSVIGGGDGNKMQGNTSVI